MSKRLLLSSLCETFQECTRSTNELISDGYFSRLSVQEETLTDLNLVSIARKHKDYVLTKKFSRREEGARSGADWLWCIGEPGTWLSLLVQAKIVNPSTSNCLSLNYRSGDQRRLLVEYSRRHQLLPLYCIYSHISDGFQPKSKSLSSLASLSSSEWSCSFIIPKFVRKLVRQKLKHQDDLLRYGLPWTFPFHYAANSSEPKLAVSLADSFEKVRSELSVLESSGKHISYANIVGLKDKTNRKQRKSWENPDPKTLITEGLPILAQQLIHGKLKATSSPIASISIVSSVPIESIFGDKINEPTGSSNLLRKTVKALPSSESIRIFPEVTKQNKQVPS